MTHPVEGLQGWTEHDGGECPLDPGAVIDVRYGDGEEAYGQKLHPGHGSWEWISAVPHETDVVAYRPVSTKPQDRFMGAEPVGLAKDEGAALAAPSLPDQGALQAQAPSVTSEQAEGAVVAQGQTWTEDMELEARRADYDRGFRDGEKKTEGAVVAALQGALEWDKARGYRMPYRVRDPIYAALDAIAKGGA